VCLYGAPAVAAAAIWWLFAFDGPVGNWTAIILVTAGSVVAERTQLFIVVRKQTVALSVNDIPLTVGLLVLSPLSLLISRVVAKCVILVLRRPGAGKSVFNLGVEALEVAVAATVAHSLSTLHSVQEPATWGAIFVGVAAADVTSAALVALAIRVTEVQLDRRQVASLFVPAFVVGLIDTTLGLVGVLVMSVNRWAGSLLVLVIVVFYFAHRAYGRFLAQHERLEQVYAFSRRVEASRPEPEAIGPLLEFIRETLNAREVTLILSVGDPDEGDPAEETPLRIVTVGADGEPEWTQTVVTGEPLRQVVFADGRSRLVSVRSGHIDQLWADAMVARNATEVILAPLRTHDRVWGVVEATDRQVKFAAFTPDEVRLLDNLARHLAAAVENQGLVERLRLQAFTDPLTGMPNRVRFEADVTEALEAAEPEDLLGIAVFGVDAVKSVNDTLGHEAGDQLVTAVATRLTSLAGETVRVARIGGNAFALLLRDSDLTALQEQLRLWHERLHPPCPAGDVTIELALSGGLAVAPIHGSNAAVLLQRATVALESARNTGQPVVSYVAAMEHGSLRRLQLATDLRAALSDDQLRLHYQPKVALDGNAVVGVEALLRWEHPEYGNVPPDEFIPLAERTGLIGPLTTFVLGTALRQCRSWLERDLRIGVAVNLSVRSLLDPELVPRISTLLAEIDVPSELLTLEITEGTVMADPDRALPVLHRLRELGIQLAVDDFGTGYSSLAYLRHLPVDDVKIDKAFVLGMGTGEEDLAIVRAIVELCHSLRFTVVAEGVEDELTRDLLRGMGCDAVQGYLVSRPLPTDRFDAWHDTWLSAHEERPETVRRLHVPGGA
jgi:diguanylate cyclase (GGDEF)-like protein